MSRTLVLGVGNPLMADDGTGLAALERLRAGWSLDQSVELVDGGTWGMSLMPAIETADRLLLLDAVRVGNPPGTVVELNRQELPRTLSHKLSPHQIDLREVFALCDLRGTLPPHAVLLGIEPEVVELADSLSPKVDAALDRLVERSVDRLRAWGHEVRRKAAVVNA